MQDADLDRVYAIEVAAHRAPWSRQIISDCIFVGYDCRVLEFDKKNEKVLASYVICRYSESICHVLNLCVAPALQGQGYGRILLQDVIDTPAKAGIETVLLEVRPSNEKAWHLYQKMGFQQTGIKYGYYRDEDSTEDALVLEKRISKTK